MLNLIEIREKEKVFLLDASISQSGLFGEAVSSVAEKLRSAKNLRSAQLLLSSLCLGERGISHFAGL